MLSNTLGAPRPGRHSAILTQTAAPSIQLPHAPPEERRWGRHRELRRLQRRGDGRSANEAARFETVHRYVSGSRFDLLASLAGFLDRELAAGFLSATTDLT